MSTWVQTVNPEDVDLETVLANHNTIKVNDVNENNDAKVAIHAINESTNVAARALKAQGEVEIQGRSTGNPAS